MPWTQGAQYSMTSPPTGRTHSGRVHVSTALIFHHCTRTLWRAYVLCTEVHNYDCPAGTAMHSRNGFALWRRLYAAELALWCTERTL